MATSNAPEAWQSTIRARLLEQGASQDWAALWPRVVTARCRLLDAIAGISEEQATWKPAADAWSIEETIRHLLRSSEGVVTIIEALVTGRDPGEDTPYDHPGEVTAHEVVPAFEGDFNSLRTTFLEHSIEFAALPRRVPAVPDLERTFPHMYFGELPARAWFAFQPVHDGAHLRQVNEIVVSDGYPD
jgi:uncharacterized damage-inducible protein DinB